MKPISKVVTHRDTIFFHFTNDILIASFCKKYFINISIVYSLLVVVKYVRMNVLLFSRNMQVIFAVFFFIMPLVLAVLNGEPLLVSFIIFPFLIFIVVPLIAYKHAKKKHWGNKKKNLSFGMKSLDIQKKRFKLINNYFSRETFLNIWFKKISVVWDPTYTQGKVNFTNKDTDISYTANRIFSDDSYRRNEMYTSPSFSQHISNHYYTGK